MSDAGFAGWYVIIVVVGLTILGFFIHPAE